MKSISKIALVIASSWLCTTAFALVPNNDDPRTFLGPTLRLSTTNPLSNDMAYSLAGEAGLRNVRIGGTLGFNIADNQRFKVSAEYLWQRINYAFFSGNEYSWVHQGALGAAYQYALNNFLNGGAFDLSAYVAHASSKTLSTITGTYVDSTGTTIAFTDPRRIAGSSSVGASPGISFNAWEGGRVNLAANYDSVSYDTSTGSANHDAKGFGGTVGLNQALTQDVGLGLSAGFRKPFTHYSANVSWNYLPWTVGIFGDYTLGKNTLPDTYNLGLSANYMLDRPMSSVMSMKGENYKGDIVHSNAISVAGNNGLLAWTADPAVYMPSVLAVVDSGCAGPRLITPFVGPFPGGRYPYDTPIEIETHFSGSNLTFSATSNQSADTITFDESEMTVTHGQGFYFTSTVTLTARNSCGTTTATVLISSPA